MLFYQNSSRRGSADDDKFAHRRRSGMERFGPFVDGEFSFEVWRRKTGLTVGRAVYSVSIRGPHPMPAAHFADLTSRQAAARKAQEWIAQVRQAEAARESQNLTARARSLLERSRVPARRAGHPDTA